MKPQSNSNALVQHARLLVHEIDIVVANGSRVRNGKRGDYGRGNLAALLSICSFGKIGLSLIGTFGMGMLGFRRAPATYVKTMSIISSDSSSFFPLLKKTSSVLSSGTMLLCRRYQSKHTNQAHLQKTANSLSVQLTHIQSLHHPLDLIGDEGFRHMILVKYKRS